MKQAMSYQRKLVTEGAQKLFPRYVTVEGQLQGDRASATGSFGVQKSRLLQLNRGHSVGR